MRFLRSIAGGVAAGILLFGLACGESPTEPKPPTTAVPTTLEATGGTGQNGPVGSALAQPLTVRVLDAQGNPMANVAVTWAVTTGGGTVVASAPATSSAGTVSATWTLGSAIGPQGVTATAGSLSRSFSATATADRPAVITATPDSLLLDAVGDSAAATWLVKDRFGNTIAAPALAFGFGSAADSAVAGVTATGMVTAKAAGRVLLRVKADTATAQLPVRVAPVIASLGLPTAPACLAAVGDTARIASAPADRNGHAVADAALTWVSRAAGIATVDTAGVVTAKANGSTWIVATATNARGAKSDSVQVCVTQAVARVEVTPALDTIQTVGRTQAFTAAALDANGTPVAGATFAWTAVTPAVASLDLAAGTTVTATARAEGSTGIVVTSGGVSDTATLVVHPFVRKVIIGRQRDTLTMGTTDAFTATAQDSAGTVITGRAVTWASRTPAVASVDGAGAVTAVAPGTAWIAATIDTKTDSVLVTIEAGCRDITHAIGDAVSGSWTASDCRDDQNRAVDRYVLTLTAQEHFRATVDGAAGRDLRLRKGSATGEYIGFMPRTFLEAPATNPVSVDYLLAPGTYVLEVSAPDSATRSAYTLRTARQTAISCAALTWATPGVALTGELANGDCTFNGAFEDVLLVHVPAGKRLRATMTTTTVRPVVAIKDDRTATGPLLSREYRAAPGTVQTAWTSTYQGGHLVIATSFGAGETGTYRLELAEVDAANTCVATPLVIGNVTLAGWESTDCPATDGRVHDKYAVQGTATAIRANLAGPAGKVLDLFVDGAWVAGNLPRADTATLAMHFFVRQGGSVQLNPVAPNGGGDSYRLSTGADTNITACRDAWAQRGAVIPGQRLEATDCSFQGAYEDRLLIHLTAGSTFNAEMTSAEFAPALYLRHAAAPPGTVLTGDSRTAAGTARMRWPVVTDGIYEIIATSSVDGATGAYVLTMPDSLATLPVARVVVTPDSATLTEGDTTTLSVALEDADGRPLTRPTSWTSADEGIATVTAAGLVTALGAGTTWISASAEGMRDSTKIMVLSRAVASIDVTPDSLDALAGDTVRLAAVTIGVTGDTLTGRAVAWSVNDTTLATLDTAGTLVTRAAGRVVVTATSEGKSDSAVVVIASRPVTGIALAPDTLRLAARDTASYMATLTDDRGAVVTGALAWSTADTTIAAVSEAGVVTGVAEGSTWVRATSGAAVDSAVVVVAAVPVAQVAIGPDSADVFLGATLTLRAAAIAAAGDTLAGRTVNWTSLDTTRATVDAAGLVTPRLLGTVRVVAAAEGKADTAVVTVRSPITRIVVAPDTLTLTAIGNTQAYVATAYDTADVAMDGVTFSWRSANPLVATVGTTSGPGTLVTAQGSGLTEIFAEALGAAGVASLRVGQYAATVDASPDSARIAVGGYATFGARVRDGNGADMPDAVVRWKAANAFVSVDSVTGQVRGLSLGVGKVVARVYNPTDTIVSDTVTVVVANDASPKLTFGAETFTVGRFASVSVPLYLSTAPAQPVTIILRTADTTVAKFSSAKVTFNAGQTQTNASLTGVLPGSIALYATDSAGTFGADTSRVQVQIKSELEFPQLTLWNWRYQEMNVGETYAGTLRISDPAPAGGLYFTIEGGGYVTPQPQTVFIPEGQLAAELTVTGIAPSPGPFMVRAQAMGTTAATFPLTVHARRFMVRHSSNSPQDLYIGRGQRSDLTGYTLYLEPPARPQSPATLDLALSASGIVSVPGSVVFGVDSARYTLPIEALANGTVTLTAAGSGWTSDAGRIIVTSPKVKLSNSSYGDTTHLGVGRGNMYASLTDSLDWGHAAIDTVRFRFWSGDPSVVTVESDTGIILPGKYMPEGQYMYMQAVGGGSTWIYSGADGYITDSIAVTVRVPKIVATGYSSAAAARTAPGFDARGSISITAPPSQGDLWFHFQSSDTLVAAADSMKATYNGGVGTMGASVFVRSRVAGRATVIISAQGYEPDTIEVIASPGQVFASPAIELQAFQTGARLYATGYDSTGALLLYATDSTTFTVQVLDTSVIRVDTTSVTFAPGAHTSLSVPVTPVNPGETQVIFSAPGLRPDTTTVVVRGVQVSFSAYRDRLGLYQSTYSVNSGASPPTVTIPTPRSEPVVVRITQRNPGVATLTTDSVVIDAGKTSAPFGWSAGGTLGNDTLFISATGYSPDTLAIEVRTPKILPGGFYGTEGQVRTTQTGVTARPMLGVDNDVNSVGVTNRMVTLHVASSDSSVMVPDSAKIHIMPGENLAYVPLRFINPGKARLIYTDSAGLYLPDSTNEVTVLAPALSLNSANTFGKLALGMRQQTADSVTNSSGNISQGFFVTVPDAVVGAPLTVDLVSSDTSVVKVPASVTIPVGGRMAFVRITAQDTTGAIAVYATAAGYLQSRLDVDVTRPALRIDVPATATVPTDSTRRGQLYVYSLTKPGGNFGNVREDLVLHLSSSDTSVVALDQTVITIPAGARDVNAPLLRYLKPGTATITVTDPRTGFTTYIGASGTITINP